MKKLLSVLLIMTAVLCSVSAIDVVIPRDYPEEGFILRLEGKPDFTVDSSIWKASSLGYSISSVTKHVWELSDGSNRVIVALGADLNDMKALEKHLDKDAEGLTLFIGIDTDVPGSFFMNYRFANVAMQSYTPDVMRSLRATRTLYYPVRYTDIIRIDGNHVDYINEKDLGSKTVEVKTKEIPAPVGNDVYEEAPVRAPEQKTIIVICPHCGEQITIKI